MKLHRSIKNISADQWRSNQVFTDHCFLRGLEDTSCIGEGTGWEALYLENSSNSEYMFSFIKDHSFGEYIFDWSWAQAYERIGMDYYPKLTSMVPFTPASIDHFIMKEFDESRASSMLEEFDENVKGIGATGSHFLFLSQRELPVFEKSKYLVRDSFQYHFINQDFETFSDFLSTLKSRKAKQIRKERRALSYLEYEKLSGDDLTKEHAAEMYNFYLSTIAEKGSYAYLTQDFFLYLFTNLTNKIVYIRAKEKQDVVAGALFLFDHDRLFGRYWGSNSYHRGLHFELCYYQGIELLIEKKLNVFEAGAQGEHKISRGFIPTKTYSAHYLENEDFNRAIGQFIAQERKHIDDVMSHLKSYLPFKDVD